MVGKGCVAVCSLLEGSVINRMKRNNRITTTGLVMVLELIAGVNPITCLGW